MTSIITILCITLLFSVLSFWSIYVKFFFNLMPGRFLSGEFWRIFTYSFVHDNIWHLVWNLFYAILCYKYLLLFNNLQFLFFYFTSSVVSIIPFTLLKRGDSVASCSGNSGVIFSIIYGYISLNLFSNLNIFGIAIPFWILGLIYFLISLNEARLNKNISLSTHISGAVFGVLYSIFFI